jgi:hypothetical protein
LGSEKGVAEAVELKNVIYIINQGQKFCLIGLFGAWKIRGDGLLWK